MSWAPEAAPQTVGEVQNMPFCPDVVNAATERDITSIVHFTRARPGLVGILATSDVKARRDLPEDRQLQHIFEENAVDRSRDRAWHGYVNLSVTDINKRMFQASRRWHLEAEWVILDFSPEILGLPGVVFCTTNNAYPAVHRHAGLRGFNQMFAPTVPGYNGRMSTRSGREPDQTTDQQAEVLYPSSLSLDHLESIIVKDEDTRETVAAVLASFGRDDLNITHNLEAFE